MIESLLGRRIAQIRQSLKLSQEELAARSGYSTEFVSMIERGINAPSVAGLARLATALRVEVRDLFDFEGIDK